MKNNDDFLSVQGNVYTLVDADGYLVREDTKSGLRFRYPISDDDTKYKAGEGLSLSGDTFSIDKSIVATKDLLSNKHKIKIQSVASDYEFQLEYDPNYDVFVNEVTLSSNILEIEQIGFTNYSLAINEAATFESWIKTTNEDDIETLSIDENITLVGDIPETLSGTFTHVFTRRIYKDANGNVKEAISYAYSF